MAVLISGYQVGEDRTARLTYSAIAAEKGGRSLAPLAVIWNVTLPPPAEPPQIVTLEGSPPRWNVSNEANDLNKHNARSTYQRL